MIISKNTLLKDGVNNDYLIEEQIGQGGFGSVYKARKMSDNTCFAIKTLSSDFFNQDSLLSFKNEISTATQIDSENVIKYLYSHDGSVYENFPPYIIMEYANKGSLSALLAKMKKERVFFSTEELVNLFVQLTKGMKAINSKLVHRDIKPDNILINDTFLKISDFGLSKISGEQTRTMTFKGYGTWRYIAPEAWNNDNNTIQMDIYSMGIVFYELATLSYPYDIDNISDVFKWKEAHLFSTPKNPRLLNNKLSPNHANIIIKMLEKSISKRFNNWDDVLNLIIVENDRNYEYSNVIDNMLNIRLQKDLATQKRQSAELQVKKEIADFCNMIKYQCESEILIPLKEFLDKYNIKSPDAKITLLDKTKTNDCIRYVIAFPSFPIKYIHIKVDVILEENFKRERTYDDFGRKFTKVETMMPTLYKKKVLAWGGLFDEKNQGFNFILLEKPNELYSEWEIMDNKNNGSHLTGTGYRTEPFVFELNELEKEISYVNVMHLYSSDFSKFSIERFIYYIVKNI